MSPSPSSMASPVAFPTTALHIDTSTPPRVTSPVLSPAQRKSLLAGASPGERIPFSVLQPNTKFKNPVSPLVDSSWSGPKSPRLQRDGPGFIETLQKSGKPETPYFHRPRSEEQNQQLNTNISQPYREIDNRAPNPFSSPLTSQQSPSYNYKMGNSVTDRPLKQNHEKFIRKPEPQPQTSVRSNSSHERPKVFEAKPFSKEFFNRIGSNCVNERPLTPTMPSNKPSYVVQQKRPLTPTLNSDGELKIKYNHRAGGIEVQERGKAPKNYGNYVKSMTRSQEEEEAEEEEKRHVRFSDEDRKKISDKARNAAFEKTGWVKQLSPSGKPCWKLERDLENQSSYLQDDTISQTLGTIRKKTAQVKEDSHKNDYIFRTIEKNTRKHEERLGQRYNEEEFIPNMDRPGKISSPFLESGYSPTSYRNFNAGKKLRVPSPLSFQSIANRPTSPADSVTSEPALDSVNNPTRISFPRKGQNKAISNHKSSVPWGEFYSKYQQKESNREEAGLSRLISPSFRKGNHFADRQDRDSRSQTPVIDIKPLTIGSRSRTATPSPTATPIASSDIPKPSDLIDAINSLTSEWNRCSRYAEHDSKVTSKYMLDSPLSRSGRKEKSRKLTIPGQSSFDKVIKGEARVYPLTFFPTDFAVYLTCLILETFQMKIFTI
ncbi:unnamed protein product [Dimorphilus gyrociliatus]|uniref:Uncharacterized protein n=1 Tax=Dimorphilus gyrociliatus TaxID=2664684 RepID=A0A7I8W3D9_9ANNE|nr:unnamed protein product [Dimorphilus gyrociliatus]